MFGDLEKLPGSPQLHRWADWAEILCLEDGVLSRSDLSSAIERRSDERANELDDESEPGPQEVDVLTSTFASPDQFKDATTQRAGDIFNYLLARADWFGASYPFEIDPSGQRMDLRAPRPDRTLYLFLLACAALRYVPSNVTKTSLASRFEWLSVEVMRRQMPASAETHLFGSNPAPGARYGGNLASKVQALAIDIRETILINVDAEFPPNNRGDNGLDIVSWVPFVDPAPGILAAFGQCACTHKWVEKQHSSSMDAWSPIFRFTVAPVNFCFVPFDFRGLDGSWYARASIHSSVLMDRRRIVASLTPDVATGSYSEDLSALMANLDLEAFSQLMAA